MKIAFLADPLDTFKTYKDSTFAMMREAARRGHAIYAFEQTDMVLESGLVSANVTAITLTGEAEDWYRAAPATVTFLSEFDAIVVRKDPPFDMEYIYTTYLLELAEKQGARVLNKPAAIRNHNEKLAIAQFPQYTAPTLVTRDARRLRAFHAEHRDIILKPLDGMGGMGIFRIGKDVPYVLARIPQGGEVRGNLAAGGLGVAQAISAREREIAEALGPILAQRGLLLVGLDVIGHYLTEINVTSPTCFQEITQQSGFDVAAMFVDALEAEIGGSLI